MNIPTKEQRERWNLERENGMVSAVGEYTPKAFWILLDAVNYLEREVMRLKKQNNDLKAKIIGRKR